MEGEALKRKDRLRALREKATAPKTDERNDMDDGAIEKSIPA